MCPMRDRPSSSRAPNHSSRRSATLHNPPHHSIYRVADVVSNPYRLLSNQAEVTMRELTEQEIAQVSGGVINTRPELAAGLIMGAGAGMVGALLGAAGGPVGSVMLGAAFAKYGFQYVEWVTR